MEENKKYINLKNGKNRENVEVDFFYSPDFKKRLWSITIYKGKSFSISGNETLREGKSLYIDANTREEVKINDIKKYKDIIPNFEESYPFLSNNSSYQTFQGKTSTEEERKAFEQEQWEKYQARRDKKCLGQN